MRNLALLLSFAAVHLYGASAMLTAEGWTKVGREHFERCEFKPAANAFSNALRQQPENARLHHWLGRSYARMAEVASPLHAVRDARKARLSLERAVELEPHNQEYLRELFDFYLNSSEWFSGGLTQAASLVEKIEPDNPGAHLLLVSLLNSAREEYHGAGWRMRQATLLPSGEIGRLLP
jgi:tetratricopeptide (TPR) repeat protein